jgi:hypothetical protein
MTTDTRGVGILNPDPDREHGSRPPGGQAYRRYAATIGKVAFIRRFTGVFSIGH